MHRQALRPTDGTIQPECMYFAITVDCYARITRLTNPTAWLKIRQSAGFMSAKDLLDLNGDFRSSPLLNTARKLHRMLVRQDIVYVIVGGLSVIRNGGVRTTQGIDILVRRDDWPRIQELLGEGFRIEIDTAVDRDTNVPVDILFAGDEWDMIFPLPDPAAVFEYDSELQANFLTLAAILELKTATYLQKKRDEGIEIAAKDLADVVELLENNQERLSMELLEGIHPRIRKELMRIRKIIRRRLKRRFNG
jgi:hypothetical protein